MVLDIHLTLDSSFPASVTCKCSWAGWARGNPSLQCFPCLAAFPPLLLLKLQWWNFLLCTCRGDYLLLSVNLSDLFCAGPLSGLLSTVLPLKLLHFHHHSRELAKRLWNHTGIVKGEMKKCNLLVNLLNANCKAQRTFHWGHERLQPSLELFHLLEPWNLQVSHWRRG